MNDTNLTQRNNADWHDSTAALLRRARARAKLSRQTGNPNAARLEREADMLEARYRDGETLMPRF